MLKKSMKSILKSGSILVIVFLLIVILPKRTINKRENEQKNLLLDELSLNKPDEKVAGILISEDKDESKAIFNISRDEIPEIVELFGAKIDAEIASALLNNIQKKKEKEIRGAIIYRGKDVYEERNIEFVSKPTEMFGKVTTLIQEDEYTNYSNVFELEDEKSIMEHGFFIFGDINYEILEKLLLIPYEKTTEMGRDIYLWEIDNLPIITTFIPNKNWGEKVESSSKLKLTVFNGEILFIEQTGRLKFENGQIITGVDSLTFSDYK